MDNPEKMSTYGTQDEYKQCKNTTKWINVYILKTHQFINSQKCMYIYVAGFIVQCIDLIICGVQMFGDILDQLLGCIPPYNHSVYRYLGHFVRWLLPNGIL
jgi:hypothetical protein